MKKPKAKNAWHLTMIMGFWKDGKRKVKHLTITKPKNWTVREFQIFAEDIAERTGQELEVEM